MRSGVLMLAIAVVVASCTDDTARPATADGSASSMSSSRPPVVRPAGPAADLSTVLTGGNGPFIGAATPAALPSGWVEEERVAAGTASSYVGADLPADGRFTLAETGHADFRTRVLIRRPTDPSSFNGTVVVEWLNVSGGLDASPDYSFMADELVRGGYAWVGVSAQFIGVEGGAVAVPVPAGAGIVGKGLKKLDPDRYGTLLHPGDAFAYDIYTQVARGLRAGDGLGGLRPERLLSLGESQSAAMLVTYANGVQPLARQFDGFLVHSRGAGAAPLGAAGQAIDVISGFFGTPTVIRNDLEVPVVVLEMETDVVALGYVAARQDDSDTLRLWEVAGAAHADRFLLGPTAETLGCAGPVNDGPQQYVVPAALRSLDHWVRTGAAPSRAERLATEGSPPTATRDADGIIVGGIRTPLVDAPVDVLSGQPRPASNIACFLSGSTDPLPADRLRSRYGTRAAYLDAYTHATDAAIDAGFVLREDRERLLAVAQPDRIPS
jgi:hypothetical protein